MSDERIDLKYYENKYTFETPIDPNWKGAPWTTADLKIILDEVARCYKSIDDLKWKNMQLLRERKDLRDEGLRLARKIDSQDTRIKSLLDALRIMRDDLDEAIAQGHLPIKSADGIDATKIRNFANDASQ